MIVDALCRLVRTDDRHRRVMTRNPGGDAIDAALAAVGAAQAWHLTDHWAVARHARYPREGKTNPSPTQKGMGRYSIPA